MLIVATTKFTILENGKARIYRPGNEITETASAEFAMEYGYAEEREDNAPPVSRFSKTSKNNLSLKGAPENADASQSPKTKHLRRIKDGEGKPVLGSEEEFDQSKTDPDSQDA